MNNQDRHSVKGRIFGSPAKTEQDFLVDAGAGVKVRMLLKSSPPQSGLGAASGVWGGHASQYAIRPRLFRMSVSPMANMPMSPMPQENPASSTGAYCRQLAPYFLRK